MHGSHGPHEPKEPKEPQWVKLFDQCSAMGPRMELSRRQVLTRAINLSADLNTGTPPLVSPKTAKFLETQFDLDPSIGDHIYSMAKAIDDTKTAAKQAGHGIKRPAPGARGLIK